MRPVALSPKKTKEAPGVPGAPERIPNWDLQGNASSVHYSQEASAWGARGTVRPG